jgi:hypothetical protein
MNQIVWWTKDVDLQQQMLEGYLFENIKTSGFKNLM